MGQNAQNAQNAPDGFISTELARFAEINLSLPESVMWDAWDICDESGRPGVNRTYFAEALKLAISRYHADPIKYTYNAQIGIVNL